MANHHSLQKNCSCNTSRCRCKRRTLSNACSLGAGVYLVMNVITLRQESFVFVSLLLSLLLFLLVPPRLVDAFVSLVAVFVAAESTPVLAVVVALSFLFVKTDLLLNNTFIHRNLF